MYSSRSRLQNEVDRSDVTVDGTERPSRERTTYLEPAAKLGKC
jgi:hypothetical protein